MKTLIITAALTLSTLFASAQCKPQHQVVKVTKVFACYERFATDQQIKTADSLRKIGFTPVDSYRIAGTRNMKVTFIKVIK